MTKKTTGAAETTIDISVLKDLNDIIPDTHAGCYQLVQKAVAQYKKMASPRNLKVEDLDMFLLFIQCTKNFELIGDKIEGSSLPAEAKTVLQTLLGQIKDKYNSNMYSSREGVGIVNLGFNTFKKHTKDGKEMTSDNDATSLINSLVDISSKTVPAEILEEAKKMQKVNGCRVAFLSAILHCLKPDVFPIWNDRSQDFLLRLPLDRQLPRKFKKFPEEYIEASGRLNQFRDDNNLQFKNWRALDLLANKLNSDGSAQPTVANPNTANAEQTKSPADTAGHRNLIYFGAPGTGKSFKLKQGVENDFVDKNGEITTNRYERVTFYPTYSYAQFVGCYKPVMNGSDIAYKFVPGPFLRVLVNALKPGKDGKIKDWCLVIEEINRANAAAVFGDVFQLLDRGSDGVSEYEVAASEDVKRFLQEEFKDCAPSKDDESEESKKRNPLNFLKVSFKKDDKENDTKEWDSCRLRIPSNMYIWATMNSADQGVFPMDTAFKRRWEFEYVGIDEGEGEVMGWKIAGKGYAWNDVRKFVNGLLSLHGVNEDKLIGTHFVKPANGSDTIAANSFESKVLMYLWEDAARMCRRQMFGDIKTFSGLLDEWRKKGVEILEKDTEINNLTGEAKTWYDILKNRSADKFEPDSEDSEGQPQG